MRSVFFRVASVVALGGLLAPAVSQGQSKADEEAIKAVLLAETDFFFARDYEGWAGTFGQAPGAHVCDVLCILHA